MRLNFLSVRNHHRSVLQQLLFCQRAYGLRIFSGIAAADRNHHAAAQAMGGGGHGGGGAGRLCPHGRYRPLVERCAMGGADYAAIELGGVENYSALVSANRKVMLLNARC